MNVVVEPDGCAELDGRDAQDVVEEHFEPGRYVTVRLEQDTVVEGLALFVPDAEETNDRARRLVSALVGAHMVFKGTVVLIHLNPQDALDLLTVE